MNSTNRNERRLQERKINKLKTWLMSFDEDQKKLWEQTILSEMEKNDKIIVDIIDECFSAAILDNINLDLIDIKKITTQSNIYIEDYKKFIEEKGDIKMPKDEKLKEKIREEAKKIQKEGIGISEGVKQLRSIYNIPQSSLHVIWAEAKEELKKGKKDPVKSNIATEEEKEKFIQEIGMSIKEKMKKHVDKELLADIKKDVEEKKELPYVVTEKEIEEKREYNEFGKIKKYSNLKIINTTIEIQGKYATYKKDLQGVSYENTTFKDVEELEKYKEDIEENFTNNMHGIKKQLDIWNEKRLELESNRNKHLNKIIEIEQVFNL